MIVTNSAVLGKTVRQLGLEHRFGVIVTRVTRADVEMTAVPNLNLQFGDVLQVVGQEDRIGEAAALLGNSLKALNQTHSVPLLAGVLAGIASAPCRLRFLVAHSRCGSASQAVP